jgi:hypothetical protein
MPFLSLVPERLTWSELPDSSRYEVWSTPQSGPRYRVYLLVNGVEVGSHGYDTVVAARKNFERMVEERS